jgi:hypothetical protein
MTKIGQLPNKSEEQQDIGEKSRRSAPETTRLPSQPGISRPQGEPEDVPEVKRDRDLDRDEVRRPSNEDVKEPPSRDDLNPGPDQTEPTLPGDPDMDRNEIPAQNIV